MSMVVLGAAALIISIVAVSTTNWVQVRTLQIIFSYGK